MTSRRVFFASFIGLGIARPDRSSEQPVTKSKMPAMEELRRLAEEKESEDRWQRIDANLARMEADNKAWDARFKAKMERMKADSDAWWERSQASGKRIDANLERIDANLKQSKSLLSDIDSGLARIRRIQDRG